MVTQEIRLQDTRRAFDMAAVEYDGPAGNNVLIQRMRGQMWQLVTATFPVGARLLDLGCGTGIDAAYFGARGYSVLAIDWSPAMVERTEARIAQNGLERRTTARVLGIQDLDRLRGEQIDGIYSNLGPLNCDVDLHRTAHSCAELLQPGGCFVASVIGRVCPWEIAYYLAHARWKRAFLRWTNTAVPVPLNGETVWTRYFTPLQFYEAFSDDFALSSYRGWSIWAPPPYMLGVYERLRAVCTVGEWLDDWLGALPLIRNTGDHFLMVMTRRS